MQNDHTDPIWKTHMEMLTRRKRQIEIGETVRKSISDWYFENGLPEPNWRVNIDEENYPNELDETE